MKKKSKNVVKSAPAKKNKSDMVFINNTFLAAAGLVIVIIFVAILASKNVNGQKKIGQNQQPSNNQSGQQVAKITILPANGSQTQNQLSAGQSASAEAENLYLAGSIPANDNVKFKISNFQKLAIQPLKFNIYDDKGKELTPEFLQSVHEKKVHLLIVSANLREYQHLYPIYFSGIWFVNAKLPNPGTYYAYTGISPIKGAPVVYRSTFVVQNETTGDVNYPGITPDLVAISGGYKVKMVPDSLIANHATRLSFQITKDDKPVANLKPYFGSFGNVSVMRHFDPGNYTQMHLAASTNEENGIIDFISTFNSAGRYTAFAEFNLGGKTVIFPITFEIQ